MLSVLDFSLPSLALTPLPPAQKKNSKKTPKLKSTYALDEEISLQHCTKASGPQKKSLLGKADSIQSTGILSHTSAGSGLHALSFSRLEPISKQR